MAEAIPLDLSQVISLWGSDIIDFSSQYNTNPNSWSARCALGPPRVYPRHGDITGSWAPGKFTAAEYITMKFPETLYLDKVEVYETYNPGAIAKIDAMTELCVWENLYTAPGSPKKLSESRIFDVPMKPTTYKTNSLKVTIDCTAAGTWVEIDAIKVSGVKTRLDAPPPIQRLSDDLLSLVESEDFSDVTFEVEGHTVKAHRVILSARSKYFQAMFSDASGMFCKMPLEKPIVLENISYAAFKVMLQYLYTNRIMLGATTHTTIVEIIRASDMYAMEDLRKTATYKLNIMISNENVVEIYRRAIEKLPVLEITEKLCTDHIAKHLWEVFKTEAFCKLPQELMLNLIQTCTAQMKIS